MKKHHNSGKEEERKNWRFFGDQNEEKKSFEKWNKLN